MTAEEKREIFSIFFKIELEKDGALKAVYTLDGIPVIAAEHEELLCEEHFDSGVGGENCGLKPSTERKLVPLENRKGKVVLAAWGAVYLYLLFATAFSTGIFVVLSITSAISSSVIVQFFFSFSCSDFSI